MCARARRSEFNMNAKNNRETIYDKLVNYAQEDICPMHMPGHKRNTFLLGREIPTAIDITEIHGFDNLHDPEGIILDSVNRAAALYKSDHTFYLINGSTCGILAGIRAVVNKGDQIIMARNCHKSVYHGVELNELKPIYIQPEIEEEYGIHGSITIKQVEEALEEQAQAALLILTSPTYEGVISDISGIVKLAHSKGIPVMVDEAHGPHLGFSPAFSGTAIEAGADIVIHSLHKTLPSLTQTSLAHINGDIVNVEEFKRQLEIFETSSPSYVLLSSIDSCIRLLEENGEELFFQYETNIDLFDQITAELKNLKILCHDKNKTISPGIHMFDIGKIVISTKNTTYKGSPFTGTALSNLLRSQYKIELEMAYTDYVIAMTSIGDRKENFVRLANALLEIDQVIEKKSSFSADTIKFTLPKQEYSIAETMRMKGVTVPIDMGINRISKEYVYFYPPGIPILVPGEKIEEEIIKEIKSAIDTGLVPKSTKGKVPEFIEVVG